MLEEMQKLATKLRRAFNKGWVFISADVGYYSNGKERLIFDLSIKEIEFHQTYDSFEDLEHAAFHILNKYAMGVYIDEQCDNSVQSQAERIANMDAPWNKF